MIQKPDVTVTTNQNYPTAPTLESNEDEGDEINPVETFIVYKPKKLKKGLSHPDIVVETVRDLIKTFYIFYFGAQKVQETKMFNLSCLSLNFVSFHDLFLKATKMA